MKICILFSLILQIHVQKYTFCTWLEREWHYLSSTWWPFWTLTLTFIMSMLTELTPLEKLHLIHSCWWSSTNFDLQCSLKCFLLCMCTEAHKKTWIWWPSFVDLDDLPLHWNCLKVPQNHGFQNSWNYLQVQRSIWTQCLNVFCRRTAPWNMVFGVWEVYTFQ